jgi:hypothetical protein
VGLDAGRDAQQHLGDDALGACRRLEPVELVEAVDHDAADAGLPGHDQLGDALVVAVQHEALGRHTGAQRHGQLAAAGHVEVHALLVGQARHGPAEERLGGVGDAVAEGGDGLGAPGAQLGLVVDEQRRAELLGQVGQVAPADEQLPVLADLRRVGNSPHGSTLIGSPHRIRSPGHATGARWPDSLTSTPGR